MKRFLLSLLGQICLALASGFFSIHRLAVWIEDRVNGFFIWIRNSRYRWGFLPRDRPMIIGEALVRLPILALVLTLFLGSVWFLGGQGFYAREGLWGFLKIAAIYLLAAAGVNYLVGILSFFISLLTLALGVFASD